MDISNLSLNDLKVIAFDLQRNLQLVMMQIQKLESTPIPEQVEAPKEPETV